MEDWLAARAAVSPHALALIIGGSRYTYADLDALVDISASRLADFVQPGQAVGVLMPNSLIYVCLIHALARIGAVLVPLNTRLTIHELSWQLDHCACVLLVTTSELAGHMSVLAGPGRQLMLDQELLDSQDRENIVPKAPFRLENPQSIIFTSGTTGKPKGVVLSFANHFWSATSSAFRLGVQADDRWLSCLPLYHVGGLAVILRSCLYGTAVVLHDRFDEREISNSLDFQAITLISLVPTMLQRLLNFRGNQTWPDSLRHVLLGGAAPPADLLQRCRERHIPLSITYGLTEAASQVATMPPHDSVNKPGSAGKPLLFTSIDILDDLCQSLPPGEVGEVCVGGPTVMARYHNDERATGQVLRNGRLHTGDMGFLDEDGDLWLVQRRQDIIITGGENVYPSEVENILLQHPAVADISVVGIADSHWGQSVAAIIELRPGTTLTIDELLEFGREKLAGYKLPRQMQFVDQLPLTASGKIHRQQVLDMLQPPNKSAPYPDKHNDTKNN